MRSPRRLAPVLLLGLLAACVTPGPAREAGCGPPHFPDREGWLGGDAAYSVPLGPSRSVWLFGDTFVAAPERTGRAGSDARLVHNSIAISACDSAGRFEIDYAWGRSADGAPRAFFDSGVEDPYWWLFDGFLHAGRLYVGLLVVEASPPRGPLRLPFRFRGMKLARIDNPGEPPERWRIEVLALSHDPRALPGSAMAVHGDHVYLFTFLDREDGRLPRMLARLALADLERFPAELPQRLEYLSRDGVWKPGLDPSDARLVMEDDASEMSVHYHSELGRWVAVYSHPYAHPYAQSDDHRRRRAGGAEAPSDRVWLRTAERLEGPWSPPHPIFRVPELDRSSPAGYQADTFCYAGKEHPQFAARGRLLVTYVCNLITPEGQDPYAVLRRLLATRHLYRPQAVSIPFPGWIEDER